MTGKIGFLLSADRNASEGDFAVQWQNVCAIWLKCKTTVQKVLVEASLATRTSRMDFKHWSAFNHCIGWKPANLSGSHSEHLIHTKILSSKNLSLFFSALTSRGAGEKVWPLTRSPFAKLFPGGNHRWRYTVPSWILLKFWLDFDYAW